MVILRLLIHFCPTCTHVHENIVLLKFEIQMLLKAAVIFKEQYVLSCFFC